MGIKQKMRKDQPVPIIPNWLEKRKSGVAPYVCQERMVEMQTGEESATACNLPSYETVISSGFRIQFGENGQNKSLAL